MRARDIYAGKSHEPTSAEVVTWRVFAQLAADVALGRRRAWRELKDMAGCCRSIRVFGHNTEGNICNRLIDVSIEAALSVDHNRYADELARLADEVLRRCDIADQLRRASRYG